MRSHSKTQKSKFFRIWTFVLLFLVTDTFNKPAWAFLSSVDSCLQQPQCAGAIAGELSPAVSAPTGVGYGASILSTTTTTTNTVKAAAGVVIVVAGATAVGVTYHYWDQAHNQAAQERARNLYCTANPFDVVCAGRVPGVLYDLKGTFVNNSLHAPSGCGTTWTWYANGLPGPIDQKYFNWDYPNLGTWGFFSWGYFHGTSYSKYMVIQDSTNYYIGASADKCIGGSGNYGTDVLTIVSVQRSDGKDGTASHPLLNWQDWPQVKRDIAVGMLTPSDWSGFIDSMPSGLTLQARRYPGCTHNCLAWTTA